MHFPFSNFPPWHLSDIDSVVSLSGSSPPSRSDKPLFFGSSSLTIGLVLFLTTGLWGSKLITNEINSKNINNPFILFMKIKIRYIQINF